MTSLLRALWLLLQAIEGFAVTVKDIAQMLQAFGTELAETDLPDDGSAIEQLLRSHTEKYMKLKVEHVPLWHSALASCQRTSH